MTPQESREADRAGLLFQAAMAVIAAKSVTDSLALWQDVPARTGVSTGQASATWLQLALRLIARRRLRTRDLALAYYRYQRALATGRTIALPGDETPAASTLLRLKREFEELAGIRENVSSEASESLVSDPEDPSLGEATLEESEALRSDSNLPDKSIQVDVISGLSRTLRQLDVDTQEQALNNLVNLGPRLLEQKIRKATALSLKQRLRDELNQVSEGRSKEDKAHVEAGRRQAAATARQVLNGARGVLFQIADSDREAIGMARVSRTGTPCGFCAMLISRGAVYKSSQGTGPQANGAVVTFGDLDLYHDNCQCYAVPVFSVEQYRKSDMFKLNREYAILWPQVTKGHRGDDAISVWRRYFREQAQERKTQVAA